MVNKIKVLKCVMEDLLERLVKYNDGTINYQINELKRALMILESETVEEIEKINKIKDIQNNIYPPRGGLSDFYVWIEDEEKRITINKPISELGDKLWELLRD